MKINGKNNNYKFNNKEAVLNANKKEPRHLGRHLILVKVILKKKLQSISKMKMIMGKMI